MTSRPSTPKPAYLISSVRVLQPEKLGAFRQAAAPLTLSAGFADVNFVVAIEGR